MTTMSTMSRIANTDMTVPPFGQDIGQREALVKDYRSVKLNQNVWQ